MPLLLAYGIFPLCIACIVGGSIWLDHGLDAMGKKLSILPGLLGLISALGADSPEISSAVSAMFAGKHGASVGVVIGSNIFNIAGLMGLSAILAGMLPLRRSVTAFNGIISLVATAIIVLLVHHLFGPTLSISLLGAILILYVLALSVSADGVRRRPGHVANAIGGFLAAIHEHSERKNQDKNSPAANGPSGWRVFGTIGGSLLLIVMGSYGLVHTSLRIGSAFGISDEIVGSLILAPLTGFPNVYTSAMVALRGNGAAVVSETLNSNTINMVVGISVPAMVFGVNSTKIASFELWWLLGLTVLALGLALWRKSLVNWMGAVIIASYLGFIAMRLLSF